MIMIECSITVTFGKKLYQEKPLRGIKEERLPLKDNDCVGHKRDPQEHTSNQSENVLWRQLKEPTLPSDCYKALESQVFLRQTNTSCILVKNMYKFKTMTGFGSSCGACKFLRRKCTTDCVFAPYFSYDQAATHFAAVHKVFGASNVSRLLLHLPVQSRSHAAITMSYEALARMQDPVYGCVAHIFALQQQVASLQNEIDILGNSMAYSTVGVAGSSSSQVPTNRNSIDGTEVSLQHGGTTTEFYQTQLASLLCQEGTAIVYQSLDGRMDREFPNLHGREDHLFGKSSPNLFEKLLPLIDDQVFVNYPLFNHNANIKN